MPSSQPVQTACCGGCGLPLTESPSLATVDREPCPTCGSTSRKYTCEMAHTIKTRSNLRARQKRPGIKGFVVELLEGWFPTRASGGTVKGWVTRSRRVDRLDDIYGERVVAEDGTVIVDKVEKLSEHRGHGSAKLK
jgi:hypothetical protein